VQKGAAVIRLPVPNTCRLWSDPQAALATRMADFFALAETLCDESHWWRYILVCRTCGQTYLFEFHEEIDWSDGDDAMYRTYLPVTGAAQAHALHDETGRGMLGRHRPALIVDSPTGMADRGPVWMHA